MEAKHVHAYAHTLNAQTHHRHNKLGICYHRSQRKNIHAKIAKKSVSNTWWYLTTSQLKRLRALINVQPLFYFSFSKRIFSFPHDILLWPECLFGFSCGEDRGRKGVGKTMAIISRKRKVKSLGRCSMLSNSVILRSEWFPFQCVTNAWDRCNISTLGIVKLQSKTASTSTNSSFSCLHVFYYLGLYAFCFIIKQRHGYEKKQSTY